MKLLGLGIHAAQIRVTILREFPDAGFQSELLVRI